MATAPTVPNFEQYNFVLGDDDEAISKQNGQNAALVSYGNALKTFGETIEQEHADTLETIEKEQADTLEAAEQIRQQAVTARNEAITARNEAQTAATDAKAIVYGDALGDLQAILDQINGASS